MPFVRSKTHELGKEFVGSDLYQVHAYHWLEPEDDGPVLTKTISKA